MEANKDFKFIEEYYDTLKNLQDNTDVIESINLVEEIGKNFPNIYIRIKNI